MTKQQKKKKSQKKAYLCSVEVVAWARGSGLWLHKNHKESQLLRKGLKRYGADWL